MPQYKNVGLFFGSFNPVHVGHMIIANHLLNESNIDQIWMVVSPQSPFKTKKSLANDYDRYHLVELAIGDNPSIRASNIEFDLPKPSYTIDTLAFLTEKFPDKRFHLIMGGDNLASLHRWKNYEIILRDYSILVYQRPGSQSSDLQEHPNIKILAEAPLLHISASHIRRLIKDGKSYRYLVPERVYEAIESSQIYRNL